MGPLNINEHFQSDFQTQTTKSHKDNFNTTKTLDLWSLSHNPVRVGRSADMLKGLVVYLVYIYIYETTALQGI